MYKIKEYYAEQGCVEEVVVSDFGDIIPWITRRLYDVKEQYRSELSYRLFDNDVELTVNIQWEPLISIWG